MSLESPVIEDVAQKWSSIRLFGSTLRSSDLHCRSIGVEGMAENT